MTKELLMGNILTALKGTTWPDDSDLTGVIHGLLRAQYTYYLNPVDVARYVDNSLGAN